MCNDKYQKHLTLQDRYDIEEGLNKGFALTNIAEKLGKNVTTISKEIRKHRIGDEGFYLHSNDCMYRMYCNIQSLCTDCSKLKRCCTCKKEDCRTLCKDIVLICVEIYFVVHMFAMVVTVFVIVENHISITEQTLHMIHIKLY